MSSTYLVFLLESYRCLFIYKAFLSARQPSDTVDNAVRSQLDDAIGNRLDELVVMAGEQDVSFE